MIPLKDFNKIGGPACRVLAAATQQAQQATIRTFPKRLFVNIAPPYPLSTLIFSLRIKFSWWTLAAVKNCSTAADEKKIAEQN